jgi:hypothetical protein
MPDMSEFHETEEEMEDRCDAQRDSEKLDPAIPDLGFAGLVKTFFRIEPGEATTDYHDCPGAKLGTCDPTNPQPDCPDCGGKGYIEGGEPR